MLSREALDEFKKLYKRHYSIELSDEEASFRAYNLVNLYKAVYGPDSFGAAHKLRGESDKQ